MTKISAPQFDHNGDESNAVADYCHSNAEPDGALVETCDRDSDQIEDAPDASGGLLYSVFDRITNTIKAFPIFSLLFPQPEIALKILECRIIADMTHRMAEQDRRRSQELRDRQHEERHIAREERKRRDIESDEMKSQERRLDMRRSSIRREIQCIQVAKAAQNCLLIRASQRA